MKILHAIGIGFTIAMLAFAAYVVWVNYSEYRKTTGTTWERLLATARNSATILWSRFCFVLAGIVAQLDNFTDLIGQPEMKDFINTWVGNPKVIAAIMLGIASITIYARTRPGSANPV